MSLRGGGTRNGMGVSWRYMGWNGCELEVHGMEWV